MEKIRLGIIGMGNMGTGHLKSIVNGECPRIEVTCFADIAPDKLERAKKILPSATAFDDGDKMIESGLLDALLITVPHYDHPKYAIKAFEKGLHVLIEKPAGVFTRQVREMNETAKRSGKVFAIMFNQRTNPIYKRAKELVESGELGELKRMTWIITNWYRTQAYYDSGSWRATWNGEGGGVLLNQAPHNLDLWQWIFGMPASIKAFCSFGKYHKIDVEDDVTIFGEYENGATASFITTTGDACGTNRLEISGDKGKLVLEDGKLKWWKLKVREREFCFSSKEGFAVPENEYEEFTAPDADGHPIVLNNFADAIIDGAPLIARGEEGLNSLTLSNAAYLSAWQDAVITLPIDEDAFEKELANACSHEKINKKPPLVSESAEKLAERWKVRW